MQQVQKNESNLQWSADDKLQVLREAVADSVSALKRLDLTIDTIEDRDALHERIRQSKQIIPYVGEERLKLTRILDAEKARIMALERSILKPVVDVIEEYKQLVTAWDQEQIRWRQEEERRIREHKAQMEALVAEDDWLSGSSIASVEMSRLVPETQRPSNVRQTWTYDIESDFLIPRMFLMVDDKAVKEAIKAGCHEIPGLRIFQKVSTAF